VKESYVTIWRLGGAKEEERVASVHHIREGLALSFREFFLGNQTLLLDGATGTQLMERGLKSGECPEKWNVEAPHKVKDIAQCYFQAGSDAVLTNTFGGSKLKLQNYGLDPRTYELNLQGCRNAIEAKPAGKFVIGSIGPSGKFMPPLGSITEKEMICAFVLQVKAMSDAGVDAILIETFADLSEMRCAIRAVKDNADLPFICSLTYDKTPKGYRTMMGISIREAVDTLLKDGAFVVGSNCGHGLLNMIEILREYRSISKRIKIIGKPNAGIPKYENGRTSYTEGANYFEQHIDDCLALKPSIIGGCCGTGPDHIKVMREAIDKRR
jgi:5-methyltetrahydrofolate--homocysteine methyltransferase